MIGPSEFQTLLLNWYDHAGRKNLPWQKNKTPYRVWVSEIMLQQTQVQTVIPYFERFMHTLPTLISLANAPEEQILYLWSGLGYYSRARNLHRAAKQMQALGDVPNKFEQLITLPGIGRSTAGAILALAYHQQVAILDGNVKRILARVFSIDKPLNEKQTEVILWDLAEKLTPKKRAADYTQAIMDLGATLCTRSNPSCNLCPFTGKCIAQQKNLITELPRKKPKNSLPSKSASFMILTIHIT